MNRIVKSLISSYGELNDVFSNDRGEIVFGRWAKIIGVRMGSYVKSIGGSRFRGKDGDVIYGERTAEIGEVIYTIKRSKMKNCVTYVAHKEKDGIVYGFREQTIFEKDVEFLEEEEA